MLSGNKSWKIGVRVQNTAPHQTEGGRTCAEVPKADPQGRAPQSRDEHQSSLRASRTALLHWQGMELTAANYRDLKEQM